jgi:small subunit ribosomal protein S5
MMVLEKNIMRPKRVKNIPDEEQEFEDRVVEVQRISRVVKGGRRIRFRALVVIGDRKGRVGMGVSKANEVADAVKKASKKAKRDLINVPICNGTIPHEIYIKRGSAKLILKPATPGTSVVAGGAIRPVLELAGITDVLSKILGTRNKINNVSATIYALSSFKPEVVEKVMNCSVKKK